MSDSEAKWYIIRVGIGKELQACNDIEDAGFEVIRAHRDQVRLFAGKPKVMKVPLYSGYAIVKVDAMSFAAVEALRSIKGVYDFLDKKNPLTQDEIDKIIAKTKQESVVHQCFEVGDTVDVISGPFANCSCVVEEVMTESKKLKLALEVFGSQMSVDVDFLEVRKNKQK